MLLLSARAHTESSFDFRGVWGAVSGVGGEMMIMLMMMMMMVCGTLTKPNLCVERRLVE